MKAHARARTLCYARRETEPTKKDPDFRFRMKELDREQMSTE
jgi:hypothetical protein